MRGRRRQGSTPKPSALDDLAGRLFSKLNFGAMPAGNVIPREQLRDMALRGAQVEGVVPYGQLPEAMRRQADPLLEGMGPPTGWDISSLKPDELHLLRLILAKGYGGS